MPSATRASAHERRALEREAEHLEVGHAEPSPAVGGGGAERTGGLAVAAAELM